MYQIKYFIFDLGLRQLTFYKQKFVKNKTWARIQARFYNSFGSLPHFIHFAMVYEVKKADNVSSLNTYKKIREKYAK